MLVISERYICSVVLINHFLGPGWRMVLEGVGILLLRISIVEGDTVIMVTTS
jgi:hypothetical protein